jgi:YggT family protein
MTAQEQNVAVDILCVALTVFWLLLLLRVILSWAQMFGFRPPMTGPLRGAIDLLDRITEPVLRPLRSVLPRVGAGGMALDLSVLVAFVILWVLRVALKC